MMTDGYPELKWLYAMVGNEEDVYCRPMLHFKHNYNYVTRATMYQWMNRHLGLGLDDPVIEQDFTPLTESETAVWSEEHPRPSQVGMEHERAICRWFDRQARKLDTKLPSDEASLKTFREFFGGAWRVIFDQGVPQDPQYVAVRDETNDGIRLSKGLLRSASRGAELPVLALHRTQSGSPSSVLIWTSDSGKDAAFDKEGKPSRLLEQLLDRGCIVVLADLMRQGEWGGSVQATGQRLVDDERSYSAFTFGYNRTLAAERCADLLLLVAYSSELLKGEGDVDGDVCLLATGQSASWAAPAAALAGSLIDRAAIVSSRFRFADVRSYQDPHFVPGAVKYGDLPALLALRAPHPVMILGEPEMPEMITQAFAAAGASHAARHESAPS